ncbi:MAG: secondary thiamine-phosphate synthase enzyme YjbQ [Desulfobacteraceae bacterium]
MKINIKTTRKSQLIDITNEIQQAVLDAEITYGLVHVFCIHTTAGIAINESADPDVRTDILNVLDRLVPWEGNYLHKGGNAAAHAKACIIGSSELLAIEDRKLVVGKWQAVFFCEFDGPRDRVVRLKFTK